MDEFDDAIQEVMARNRAASRSLMGETSPDDAARAFELSRGTGVPAQNIAPDIKGFEAQTKGSLGQEVIKNNAYIQDFVNAHPLHGPLVSDDVGSLDNVSRSYRGMAANVGSAAWSGFKQAWEGFEADRNVIPEADKEFAQNYPRLYNQLSWLKHEAGLPLDVASRLFSGGIEAARRGAEAAGAPSQMLNEAAGLAEYLLQRGDINLGKPSIKAPQNAVAAELGTVRRLQEANFEEPPPQAPGGPVAGGEMPPSATTAAAPGGTGFDPEILKREMDRLEPWIKAGREPPLGVSPLYDSTREDLAKAQQDSIKQALDDGDQTALKARDPAKFNEFLTRHPDVTLDVEKQAILQNPKPWEWIGDLEGKLNGPGQKISVSGADFLTHFDRANWNDVKDFVTTGDHTLNEIKAAQEGLTADSLQPIRDQVAKAFEATGLAPEQAKVVGALEASRYGTRAKALGVDPTELFASEGPKIQKAMGEISQGRSFYQRRIRGFYSAVGKAVEASKQPKASPEQWLATLRNTAGIKPEELTGLGLEPWLRSQGKAVTKEALGQFIEAHQMHLVETEKSGPEAQPFRDKLGESRRQLEELRAASSAYEEGLSSQAFNQGLSNREISRLIDRDERVIAATKLDNELVEEQRKLSEEIAKRAPAWTARKVPGASDYRELIAQFPEEITGGKGIYTNSHWGDQITNPIGHIRFGAYKTAEGKRVMMIQEIQSDWHEDAAKKGGYQEAGKTEEAKQRSIEATAAVEEASDKVKDAVNARTDLTKEEKISRIMDMTGGGSFPEKLTPAEDAAVAGYYQALEKDEKLRAELTRTEGRPPQAPFKTSWPELLVKRAVSYAVEHGFDKIGWPSKATTVQQIQMFKDMALENNRWMQEGQDVTPIIERYTKDIPRILRKQQAIKDSGGMLQQEPIVAELKNVSMFQTTGDKWALRYFDPTTNSQKVFPKVFDTQDAALDWLDNPIADHIGTLDLTPEIKKAVSERGFPLMQLGEDEPLGRTTFGMGRPLVEMFQSGDLETALHELAHTWLEEFLQDSTGPLATERMKADLGTLLKELGVESPDQIEREHHEAFAEKATEYFREGKGPPGLESIFQRLAQWLVDIARKVVQAQAPLSEEMRGFFDRLLADDGALEGIRDAGGLDPIRPDTPEGKVFYQTGPLASGKAIGETKKNYQKLLDLIEKQDREDVAWRLQRALKQATLENSQEWKARSKALEPDIRSEVEGMPEIMAWNYFEKGEIYGQKLPRRPKIDRLALTPEQFQALPESWIRDGGKHPDQVAAMFGYSTGQELMDALSAVARETLGSPGKDIVDRLTKARLDQRLHAELDGDAADRLAEVQDHALSLTTMEMLHEQTMALAQNLGAPLPLNKAAMDWGSFNELKKMKFGGLSAMKLLAQSRTSLLNAKNRLLENNPLEALKELQLQYQRAQMSKLMGQVEKEARAFERTAKQFRDREVKGYDSEYTDWIHDTLLRVGRPIRRSIQDLQDETKANESGTSLFDFVNEKRRMGAALSIPDFMFDPNWASYASPKAIANMTVDEARQVFNAVKSLKKAGRDEATVEIQGQKLDLAQARQDVNSQLKLLGPGKEPSNVVWAAGRKFLSATLQTEFLVNRMDFGNVFGKVTQWIIRDMVEGANSKSALDKKMAKELPDVPSSINLSAKVPNTIFKRWQEALQTDGKLDWAKATTALEMTHKNLLAVMHNLGNPDNLQRLAQGYGLEPQQVMDWVNSVATKAHWDYVQRFGNVFKQLKDQSDKMYRRLSGNAPESVPVFPIDTPHGQYAGWYHPIIHDYTFPGRHPGPASDLFAKEYQMVGTPDGYTKSRTEYRGPLDLNLDGITNRLVQEIHDVSFREPVIKAWKLIGDPGFQRHVTAHLGRAYSDMLVRWVKDVANAANMDTERQAIANTTSEYFRQNVIGTLVGLNPRTIQKHTITAAINSMAEVGPTNWLREFAAIHNPMEWKQNWDMAMDKSEELQRRHQNFQEQVSGTHQTNVGTGFTSTFNQARAWALRTGTAPVAFFDLYSAVPTWLARYNELIDKGFSEGDAVYGANTAVRKAHGSSAITSRPGVMRSSPWMASLYGFFNHVANQQYQLAWRASDWARGVKPPPAPDIAGHSFTFGLFAYVIAPAIVEELVTPYTNSEHESWGKRAAKGLALGLSSSWVGIRDLARALIDGKDPELGIGPAGVKELTDLVRDLNKGDVGLGREHAGKTLKHAIVAFGGATGLTNAAEGNLAEYLYNLHTGKEKGPKDFAELYRGVTKGTTQPPTPPDILERLAPGKRYTPPRNAR